MTEEFLSASAAKMKNSSWSPHGLFIEEV